MRHCAAGALAEELMQSEDVHATGVRGELARLFFFFKEGEWLPK